MRAEPGPVFHGWDDREAPTTPRRYLAAVAVAAAVGLGLMADALGRSSATYDEVAYLKVAARWWRTGRQDDITRMGSPLTFWKIQQAPVLWALDRAGRREWVDDPVAHQARLLPVVRAWSSGMWLVALAITAAWARWLYGPRAMAMAAWLFALGPNLLAHGPLATMEMPLLVCTTAMYALFWRFLRTGDRRSYWATAALGGLAFSCKFTAVLVPPSLALAWWFERRRDGERGLFGPALRVGGAMVGFVAVMGLANLAVTGFATLPLSAGAGAHPRLDGRFGPVLGRWVSRAVETPIPQDWVGFAIQTLHQRSGGSSYLFGARRMTGWWYYYLVAMAVKVPLTFWLLVASRAILARSLPGTRRDAMLPIVMIFFLVITAIGSSRNYGLRYLLPIAPLTIVWVSALAEAGAGARRLAAVGLLGQAAAVAAIHPHELSYFNALAGGPDGGRRILSDSNLDWGQGLRSLARLQRDRPELRDLTLYYFGDTDPSHYGVVGRLHTVDAGAVHPGLPAAFEAETTYVAVSASLQWGPWGPPGYFARLDGVAPALMTDDRTIAIYRSGDIPDH
jgi:4-amino-4-deoxy-L-arabinose transferase-like glycosyltransferase